MRDFTHFVGLDVHKDSIAVAVAEKGRQPARVLGRYPNDLRRLLKVLDRLAPRGNVSCGYEAGPTGYGLQRALTREGIACDVIAPSRTPEPWGNRIKTDRRDAALLAHFQRSGDLVSIRVPEENCEALRALVRAREDARRDQHRSRQRLSKFLLVQGRIWPRTKTWTQAHLSWIEQQHFEHPALEVVRLEYLQAVREETERVERLDARLADLVPKSELAALVEALQAFRGIKLLSAATIAFELIDLRRFAHPKQLMSFCGVVPGEDSSGERVQRVGLTKAGNKAVRRILTEVAWNYRFRPAVSADIRKRSRRVAPGVKALAWKAQLRLHGRYVRLKARGKSHNKVLMAVARELLGFIWAVGQEEQLLIA